MAAGDDEKPTEVDDDSDEQTVISSANELTRREAGRCTTQDWLQDQLDLDVKFWFTDLEGSIELWSGDGVVEANQFQYRLTSTTSSTGRATMSSTCNPVGPISMTSSSSLSGARHLTGTTSRSWPLCVSGCSLTGLPRMEAFWW
jgi:hypothetical protein